MGIQIEASFRAAHVYRERHPATALIKNEETFVDDGRIQSLASRTETSADQ
jgi:hypothetical protein